MLAADFVRAAEAQPCVAAMVEGYCNAGLLQPLLRPWPSRIERGSTEFGICPSRGKDCGDAARIGPA